MTIEIPKEVRQQAISSIERYFQENMDEQIGNLRAGALLSFFVEEIGPVIYNMAVAEVQERLQTRVMEIDLEVNEAAFQYWRKYDQAKKKQWLWRLNFGVLLLPSKSRIRSYEEIYLCGPRQVKSR